ncbi:MAG: mechanosensitive ion channel [Leptolyngbya sp. RL_3_1]|nr:mechanosensitive ion channel [Leptolyngbya sp. RL_3_1]
MDRYLGILQDLLTRFGLNAIAAIAIFLIGRWAAQLVRRIIRRVMVKAKMDPTLTSFVIALSYYGVLTMAVIAALNRLGIQTASLVAVLGAAGLAIGLALQGSLSNFASGALIIIFRPFNVGDLIEGGGVFGRVEDIDVLTTALVTLDNKRVTIPNAKLTGNNIVNYSALGKLRVDTVIGVSYGADIDRVKAAIADTLSQDPLVLKNPQPTVAVMELADSSVKFAVRPWAHPDHYWQVYFNTQEAVKKRLDAEGIVIPFPQRDVHVFSKINPNPLEAQADLQNGSVLP